MPPPIFFCLRQPPQQASWVAGPAKQCSPSQMLLSLGTDGCPSLSCQNASHYSASPPPRNLKRKGGREEEFSRIGSGRLETPFSNLRSRGG